MLSRYFARLLDNMVRYRSISPLKCSDRLKCCPCYLPEVSLQIFLIRGVQTSHRFFLFPFHKIHTFLCQFYGLISIFLRIFTIWCFMCMQINDRRGWPDDHQKPSGPSAVIPTSFFSPDMRLPEALLQNLRRTSYAWPLSFTGYLCPTMMT